MTVLVLAAALLLQSPGDGGGWAGPEPPEPRLALVRRVARQDQGAWQVDYTLRAEGSSVSLRREDLGVRVEGFVSNSRVAAHAFPRRAACAVEGRSSLAAYAEVIRSEDEAIRCREKASLALLAADDSPLGGVVRLGEAFTLRLRLEHEHVGCGDYDPLLGRREVALRVGPARFVDTLLLDAEQYRAMPRDSWPAIPPDRRGRPGPSGRPTLRLDCDEAGNTYYRFPERRVRPGMSLRLRFRYRVAPGSPEPLFARIAQYRASPERYRTIPEGAMELPLGMPAEWTRFERAFRAEAGATEVALDFRLGPCDVGEAWIDDVTLEAGEGPPASP